MSLLVLNKPKTGTIELDELQATIDALGAELPAQLKITAQIKKLKAQQDDFKDRLKQLVTLAEATMGKQHPADETFTVIGQTHRCEFGKKGTNRTIKDLEQVQAILGDEVFYSVASVPLKDIDAYLTPPEKELVLEVNRTDRSAKIAKR